MFFADAAAFESFIPLFVLYFLSFFLVVFPFSQFFYLVLFNGAYD